MSTRSRLLAFERLVSAWVLIYDIQLIFGWLADGHGIARIFAWLLSSLDDNQEKIFSWYSRMVGHKLQLYAYLTHTFSDFKFTSKLKQGLRPWIGEHPVANPTMVSYLRDLAQLTQRCSLGSQPVHHSVSLRVSTAFNFNRILTLFPRDFVHKIQDNNIRCRAGQWFSSIFHHDAEFFKGIYSISSWIYAYSNIFPRGFWPVFSLMPFLASAC